MNNEYHSGEKKAYGTYTEKLLYLTETKANIFLSRIMLFFAACCLICFALAVAGILALSERESLFILISAFTDISAVLFCYIGKGRLPGTKYVMELLLIVSVFLLCRAAGGYPDCLFLLPVCLSCKYFSVNFTKVVSACGAVALTISCAIRTLYSAGENFSKKDILYICFALAVFAVISIVCISVSKGGNKIIVSQFEAHNRNIEIQKKLFSRERELSDTKTKLALSQIKPHFIYNTLNTISYLCRHDNAKAVEAISVYSDYMKDILRSLDSDSLIPFSEELELVEKYLWIEKLRFGDELEIEWNINEKDFSLPPLTIQPIVENAVKHGICARADGGKITISSSFSDGEVRITVSDNGVGFDTGKTAYGTGLKNVCERLSALCDGKTEINSRIGEGTDITVIIKTNRV